MSEELKPCPFCGGKAEMADTVFSGVYRICCKECGASTELTYNVHEAIENWNRRETIDVDDGGKISKTGKDMLQILSLWEVLQGIEDNEIFIDTRELLRLRVILSYFKRVLNNTVREVKKLLLSQGTPVSAPDKGSDENA